MANPFPLGTLFYGSSEDAIQFLLGNGSIAGVYISISAAPAPLNVEVPVMSREDLLGKERSTSLVLDMAHPSKAREFMELALSGTEYGHRAYFDLGDGIIRAKEILEAKKNEMRYLNDQDQAQAQNAHLQSRIEKRHRQETIFTQIEETIMEAEKIHERVFKLRNRERPTVLDQDFLEGVFRYHDVKAHVDSSDALARSMFVDGWHHIADLKDEELLAILDLLRSSSYVLNPAFSANIMYYESLGVIGPEFARDSIYGSKHHSSATLQGFVGIYLRKCPEFVADYTFTPVRRPNTTLLSK